MQMIEINIKELTKADAIESVAGTLWIVANSGFQGQAGWTEDQLLQSLHAENSIVLAAETLKDETKQKVGVLIASKTFVESDIYMIVVREEYKQRGIGQQLLQALVAYCRKENLEKIFLEVRESNCPARKLYESVGFEKIGRRRAYYSQPIEDALMMKLDL